MGSPFFVISGYLVSKSEVHTIREYIKRVMVRIVRLGLPLFFTYIVIYFGIYKTIGFLNTSTDGILTNTWFQMYYNQAFTILDVLMAPIKTLILGSDSSLNPPFWCISSMFYASIIIYALNCLKWKVKNKTALLSIYLLALIGSTFLDIHAGVNIVASVVAACMVGFVAQKIISYKDEIPWKSKWFALSMVLVMLLYAVLGSGLYASIIFSVMLILLGKLGTANELLSSKMLQGLGKISWGIYGFHFPIFSSLGMLVFLGIYRNGLNSCALAYGISILTSLVATICLSVIYYFSFDKITLEVLRRIKG